MAVVDALFVRPFSAKPFLPGQRLPRLIRCDGTFCIAHLLRGCAGGRTDEGEHDDSCLKTLVHWSLLELLFAVNRLGSFIATRNLTNELRSDCPSFSRLEIAMTTRRSILLISTAFLIAGSSAWASDPIKMFDLDSDGSLDLGEVKKAAADVFARLDANHDGTLDKRELRGRLSARELAAADPDHDGTLSLDEYLAVVEKRFHAANRDADGTLDAKELRTPAGRALLHLLK